MSFSITADVERLQSGPFANEDELHDITVRKAKPADARMILECLRIAFEPYRTSYTPEAFADTVLSAETIQQRLAFMCIFVAVNADGDIIGTIGCAVVNAREGHLRGMAVLPEWQGRGIAEQLLRAAEAELASRMCLRVTLDTTKPLLRATHFYERRGYRPSGKVSDFFGMPLHEYRKELTS